MTGDLPVLLATAAGLGCAHAALGPDHYVPLVALAGSRGWNATRAAAWTLVAGLGHVLGSVALGSIGVALGLGISRLESLDEARAGLAAWLLIATGLAYLTWGLRRALRARFLPHARTRASLPHRQHRGPCDTRRGTQPSRARPDRNASHDAKHLAEGHRPGAPTGEDPTAGALGPGLVWLAFVLGPCEPLVPLLLYPAATGGWAEVALVAAAFSVTTLATMLGLVLLGLAGWRRLPAAGLERFGHAAAGASLLLCGVGVRFLGL